MSGVVFGKLPAHGDFVARGLAAGERDALDAWLSASLDAARAALGEEFADRHDRALPWRATGAGVAGAIAASQDAAGRRFPILLLANDSAERCEELLYRAIGEGWPVDRLAGEIAAAPFGPVDRWTGPDRRALAGPMPSDLIGAMLA